MNRLMQSASVFTLAAAIAVAPFAQAQQQTESDAEQAAETVVQETEEAAEAAGETIEQAGEAAVQETEEAAGEAAEAVDQTSETIEAEVIVEDAEDSEVETAEPVQPAAEGTATVAEMPAEEVRGAIVMQDENSFLTTDLMDASVYSATGEKVGDIDDVILSLDGMVEGVVIGVGGFLGIGEKHVAVEMQQLSLQTEEDGDMQLIIDTTKEALEAAPDFVSVEEQRNEAERQALQQPATEPAGGGLMTADPAPAGMAPAGEEQPATTGN